MDKKLVNYALVGVRNVRFDNGLLVNTNYFAVRALHSNFANI